MVQASLYRARLYKGVTVFFLPATYYIVICQLIVFVIQELTNDSEISRFWATTTHYEIWRYITYGFLHASYMHLVSNISMTLVLAPTLEFIHGPFVVLFIWLSSVFLGGWYHVHEHRDGLAVIGSSAGVYGILVARLWDVYVNTSVMKTWPLQFLTLFALGLPGLIDWITTDEFTSTSHSAHIGGAVAGLLTGLICIKKISNDSTTNSGETL